MFHRKSLTKSLLAGAALAAGLQQPSLGATPFTSTRSSSASPTATSPQDQTYTDAARQWAAANCVTEKRSNTTAGAVIGGLLGAAAGTGLAGRHDRAAGAILGGATGAVAGGAIGNASTPPGCPPGYVVRPVAPVYYAPPPPPVWYPAPAYPGVVYAGPGWYGPWA
jgi:outer membrane lipoprotein SlyB